ncbi:hypothetical protein HYT26_00780 [Candidatus Pacearchaeota archaeon]|nr:hypothetical protein [Candidatus Pacearchaeota archaeon]
MPQDKILKNGKLQIEVMPEIRLQCPNCKADFNIEAIHRIYRAYLALTRTSRKTSYKVICCVCGKHTHVRVMPLYPQEYKCKQCLSKAKEQDRLGYKKNPLANKRLQ